MRKRKRCPFCRCLFSPDERVRRRQWACTKPDCQVKRRRKTQERYRDRHPADRAARALRAQLASAKAGEAVAPPRAPPPGMERFPWEELRDEIPAEALVMTQVFVRLVLVVLQDEIRLQQRESQGQFGRLPGPGREDETAALERPG